MQISDKFGFGQSLAKYFRQKHAAYKVSTAENKNSVTESINLLHKDPRYYDFCKEKSYLQCHQALKHCFGDH